MFIPDLASTAVNFFSYFLFALVFRNLRDQTSEDPLAFGVG